MSYFAKVIKYVDENFSLGCTYECIDNGLYYMIRDNHNGEHRVLKTGQISKRFIFKEV